jgi:MFS family permease
MSWGKTFAALKYRNYKLWFRGQLISLMGSWMQATAQGFLIYQLTHSPAYLGYVAFASGIPTWIFMLYAGVIADRIPRRTVLIITQTAMMILAFILASLTFLGLVKPWHILLLAFGLGVANAFDAPARQAFVNEMVDIEDMTNAIALNSAMFNTATAVGPALAGIIYALVGPAWCFTINGLSFIAVIVALLLMKLRPQVSRPRGASTLAELKEGLHYVLTHRIVRTLVSLILVVSLFGMAFATLIPAWAVKILNGNAKTNGFLQSARGIGALFSALLIASLGRFRFKGKLLTLGTFSFPILLIIFSFIRWIPLSLLLLTGVGTSLILVFNLANSFVQTLTPDALRGRVMAIYSLFFFGSMPVGGLWAGFAAQHLGPPAAVIIGASVTLVFAFLVYLFVPKLRATY